MFEKEAEEYAVSNAYNSYKYDFSTSQEAFKDGAEYGYNKANKEIKLLKETHRQSIGILVEQIEELHKANEWHKADVPTSPINKVVLGYIKHYNSKLFCLVGWNGEWWYDASTYNDEVKLIAWKEIVLPKESE